MIAISSFRPFSECAPEIALNQTRAKDSWDAAFDKVIYFGNYEPQLASERTEFIPYIGQPRIHEMCAIAALQPDWACLINADIVIGAHWASVEHKLRMTGCDSAVSFRYQFKDDRAKAERTDMGLDVFCAKPHVWAAAERAIPERFVLGKILWDTWMLSFLVAHTRGSCGDLSPSKVVFHPIHGNRNDQAMQSPEDEWMKKVQWPTIKIV